jgi:AraC family transcriptional regulator
MQTLNLYADRIDRVLNYLQSVDLSDGAPTLEELASVAAVSPFHFHRLFRLLTGERVGDAVRRIRLARALPDLDQERSSVTSAAAASGYATSQAFARALRSEAGMTASEARGNSDARARLEERLVRSARKGASPLSVEVVSLEPFRLLAIRNVGDPEALNLGYERLFEAVFASLPVERLRGVYGIPWDDPRFEAPDRYRFEPAIDVGGESVAPAGVFTREFGGGTHLRLRHVGDYVSLHDSIDSLYAVAILEGREVAADPLRVHYVDTPEDAPEEHRRSDIYLRVEDGG